MSKPITHKQAHMAAEFWMPRLGAERLYATQRDKTNGIQWWRLMPGDPQQTASAAMATPRVARACLEWAEECSQLDHAQAMAVWCQCYEDPAAAMYGLALMLGMELGS